MRLIYRPAFDTLRLLGAAVFVVLLCAQHGARAQSTDVGYPTPVFSNEIAGRIAPRDLGDARLTRHFYTFNGREGDLLVTVETTDLNGDVDLFLAGGLRPLVKVPVYASTSATSVTRSVYLRGEEALILRVEARAASESEGAYRIRVEGAFAPASTSLLAAAAAPETTAPEVSESARRGGGQRATATGARIAVPVLETLPTDTNETAGSSSTAPNSEAATSPTEPAATSPRRRNRAGTRRTTSGSRRNRPPLATTTETTRDESEDEKKATETSGDSASESATTAAAPAPRTRNTRRGRARPSNTSRRSGDESTPTETNSSESETTDAANTPAPAPVVTATRLVIETKDGSRIERDMNEVRRVSVERNQLVIVSAGGKIERIPMANVARMSIEP